MKGELVKELQVHGSLSPILSVQENIKLPSKIKGFISKKRLPTLSVDIEKIDLKVTARLNNDLHISGQLSKELQEVCGTISPGNAPAPLPPSEDDYTGEYFVVPLADEQIILDTKYKRMLKDVTVDKIPYYETSNPSNGYTVIIG